jgi:hypothetical protein
MPLRDIPTTIPPRTQPHIEIPILSIEIID